MAALSSEELAARYAQDGFVMVEGLLTGEELAMLRKEALKMCRNEARTTFFGQDFTPPRSDDEALDRYLCIHFPHKLSGEITDIVAHHDPTNAVLRTLIGSPNVKVCQSMLFLKRPGDPGQAWHQDEHYIPTRDVSLTATWMPLDDTDIENGCLWVWPGSHRRRVIFPHANHGDTEHYHAGDMAQSHGYAEADAVPVPMKAGDVIFFHGYLLHRSLENRPQSGRRRRVLTNHYLSAESLLPWQGLTDNRDVLLCCGEDPYEYKGTDERNRAFVRPRIGWAAYTKEFIERWERDQDAFLRASSSSAAPAPVPPMFRAMAERAAAKAASAKL